MKVNLKDHSYHIVFDKLANLDQYLTKPTKTKVLIISNPKVFSLYGPSLVNCLKEYQVFSKLIPAGEKYKTLSTAEQIHSFLIKNNFCRQDLIVALGGGVIGDLSGFVASTFLRGIDYVQVSTTLLSQVDASVGGKTAVNHRLGKNLIGTFYQPILVLIDKNTLQSLSARELSAGMAEVIKYGIIKDQRFFRQLESNLEISNNVLAKCCLIKSKIVEKDEKEKGLRMILNFGHTIGHALEAETKYQHYLHGEAVALGMLAATHLSYQLKLIELSTLQQVKSLIAKANLPTKINYRYNFSKIKKIMEKDKKANHGKINFILIDRIGRTVIRDDVSWDLVKTSLEFLKNG